MSIDELAKEAAFEKTRASQPVDEDDKEGQTGDAGKPALDFGDEQLSAEDKDGHTVGQPVQETEPQGPVIRVRMDDSVADISLDDLSVRSDNEAAQRRIESVLQVALRTITPLAPIRSGSSWASTNGSKRIAVKTEE